jgi:hypothetical protein
MGLRPLVGLAVGIAVAILWRGKRIVQKSNRVGTTGVLGMSCTLGLLIVL